MFKNTLILLVVYVLTGCSHTPILVTPIDESLNSKSTLNTEEGYLVFGFYGLPNTTLFLRKADSDSKEIHSEQREYAILIDDHLDFVKARIPQGIYYLSRVEHKPPNRYSFSFHGISPRDMRIEIKPGKVNYAGNIGAHLDGMTHKTKFYRFDNSEYDRQFLYKVSPQLSSLDWVNFRLCRKYSRYDDDCEDVSNRYTNYKSFTTYMASKYRQYGDPVKNEYTKELASFHKN